jgi:hypothetical protein
MPCYYAYLIDIDGRIAKRDVIVCDDDEQAKRVAKQMTDCHAIELWQEARATFEPGHNKTRLLIGGFFRGRRLMRFATVFSSLRRISRLFSGHVAGIEVVLPFRVLAGLLLVWIFIVGH